MKRILPRLIPSYVSSDEANILGFQMTIPETSAVGAAHEVITLLVNYEADDVEEAAKVTVNGIIKEPATSNVAAS